ncbi:amidohydrolase [Spongisporangium articulatum]|uniref:Amidohydrolase n=1 Tax=Spongisporangium articulatum TaxID=3362603 RepID=A0ABW8AU06_9ACTN
MTQLLRNARLLDGRLASLVVDGGTVAWIGPADSEPVAVEDLPAVDVAGRLLLPAFVDAHVHLTETALLMEGLDLTGARSVTEILDAVAAAARSGRGRTVLGHGWDELRLTEERPPSRAELDRAADGGEVYLARVDVHSAVVSSALAERAGAPVQDGWDDTGRVERDAHHVVRRLTRYSIGADERRRLQILALRAAAAAGITEVHEMSAPHVAPEEDLRGAMSLTGGGLPRVVGYHGEAVTSVLQAQDLVARLGPVAGLAGDLMADGSLGSRTAALISDYADAPGHRGHRYLSEEQVRDHVVACTLAGLQAGFHAIGDDAVACVLAGFEAAAAITGERSIRNAGHRVEHVEAIDERGVQTMARLGLAASVQPGFDERWGGPEGMYAQRLGPERAAGLNPFASMVRAGVRVLFGSDSPVTPFAPWQTVRAAVRHGTEEHRIALGDALRAHVTPGVGLVPRVGAPADLVAWEMPEEFSVTGVIGRRPQSDLEELLTSDGEGDMPVPGVFTAVRAEVTIQ